jgi:hypothetical protein
MVFIDRTRTKSQVLADFIANWTLATSEEQHEKMIEKSWDMYYDGAYCDDGSTSSAVLISPSGKK